MKSIPPSQLTTSGFTLTECLVVIVIICVLAALLLPALGRGRDQAQKIQCQQDLHQIFLAWRSYIDDNDELLPPNLPAGFRPTWVRGWLDYASNNQDNTNTAYLINFTNGIEANGHLAPYLGRNSKVFKCPTDTSQVIIAGEKKDRVRSVSMNGWLNTSNGCFVIKWSKDYRNNGRFSDLDVPGPANIFVFLDEREDSMNDGYFEVAMTNPEGTSIPGSEWILDYPASYHNRAANLSFADGHVEAQQWKDSRTTPQLKKNTLLELVVPSPGNVDITWLRQHTTGLK